MPKKKDHDDEDIVVEEEEHADSFGRTPKEKKLKGDLATADAKAKEYLAGWQRAKADLINYKREVEEGRSAVAKFAAEGLIHELLPVMDSFEMAFRNKDAWEKADETWRRGVEYIYAQLLSALESHGVKHINPIHEAFNPTQHDSLGTTPTDNPKDDGKITEVIQKGYELHGKIIRAAKVRVGELQNK